MVQRSRRQHPVRKSASFVKRKRELPREVQTGSITLALRRVGRSQLTRYPRKTPSFLLASFGGAGDVVRVADDQRRVVAAGGHVQRFVKLPAIIGQFEGAAHFAAAGILFVGDQAVAVPFGGDLLIIFIFGFL